MHWGQQERSTQINVTPDLRLIYKERRDRMLKACAAHDTRATLTSYVKNNIIIDQPLCIAFCPVEKIASTFLRRLMRIVVGLSHASSPFDESVRAFDAFYTLRGLPDPTIERFMNESLTIMFVREPYSRLFSAYVDKLVSPNCDYWKGTGAFGIRLFRNNSKDIDQKCGHDLTFREFVKTIIHFEEHEPFSKRNVHFTPTFEHCDPCLYKWHVIGKMEIFEPDVFHLMDRMGRTDLRRSLENNFRAQYLKDTIRDQFNWLFHFRKHYANDCNMTFYEAQKRLWKQLQIRGILEKQSTYPITAAESENMNKEELITVVYTAMGNAGERSKARRNTQEDFLEAYSTIDNDDMVKLSKMFSPDCEMFGYDCKPDILFNMKRTRRIIPIVMAYQRRHMLWVYLKLEKLKNYM